MNENETRKCVFNELARIIEWAPKLQQLAQREADEEWLTENHRIITLAAGLIECSLDILECELKDKYE